jgi:hypothetical protein
VPHPTSAGTDGLLVPITLELSPIRRLLGVAVPDEPTHHALEPQVLDGPGGSGLVLLAYRHDGHVEVYAEAELVVDASGYDGLGAGLLGIHHATFEAARFEVGSEGLRLDVAFSADGHRFELHVHERLTAARDRFPVLAPVGGAFETPDSFPFVWLPGLSFVPARSSEVALRIDGEPRSIPRLPLPIGGRRCLMARYDPEVMACRFNTGGVTEPPRMPSRRTAPASREGRDGREGIDGADEDGQPRIDLVAVDGRPGIAGIRVERGRHTCAAVLDPPVPDLVCLPDGARREGSLLLQADHVTELRAGYELTRYGDRVDLAIAGFGPWRTRQRRPLLAVLFRLPIFRRWPTTYRWDATLDLAAPETRWTSRWSRSPGDGDGS